MTILARADICEIMLFILNPLIYNPITMYTVHRGKVFDCVLCYCEGCMYYSLQNVWLLMIQLYFKVYFGTPVIEVPVQLHKYDAFCLLRTLGLLK